MKNQLILRYISLSEKHLDNTLTESELQEYRNILELIVAVNFAKKLKKTYQNYH